MLIAFKSKSSPEVLMFQEHAQRILDLLHKNPTRGVITAAEAAQALSVLEHEVSESKLHPETDIEHDIHAQATGSDGRNAGKGREDDYAEGI